jgi:hypothetical protein
MDLGIDLMPVWENLSISTADSASVARHGLDFVDILSSTPRDLLERDVYAQISISLKDPPLRTVSEIEISQSTPLHR